MTEPIVTREQALEIVRWARELLLDVVDDTAEEARQSLHARLGLVEKYLVQESEPIEPIDWGSPKGSQTVRRLIDAAEVAAAPLRKKRDAD